MSERKKISSSQPSPYEVTEVWDQAFMDGYETVVYIPMSSGISGSYQTAAALAQDYGGRVYVVDNHRISVTQRFSVLEAIDHQHWMPCGGRGFWHGNQPENVLIQITVFASILRI